MITFRIWKKSFINNSCIGFDWWLQATISNICFMATSNLPREAYHLYRRRYYQKPLACYIELQQAHRNKSLQTPWTYFPIWKWTWSRIWLHAVPLNTERAFLYARIACFIWYKKAQQKEIKHANITLYSLLFLRTVILLLTIPDHISCTDHQKEWDEIRTFLTLVVCLKGSSKMLVQASRLSEEVPENIQL